MRKLLMQLGSGEAFEPTSVLGETFHAAHQCAQFCVDVKRVLEPLCVPKFATSVRRAAKRFSNLPVDWNQVSDLSAAWDRVPPEANIELQRSIFSSCHPTFSALLSLLSRGWGISSASDRFQGLLRQLQPFSPKTRTVRGYAVKKFLRAVSSNNAATCLWVQEIVQSPTLKRLVSRKLLPDIDDQMALWATKPHFTAKVRQDLVRVSRRGVWGAANEISDRKKGRIYEILGCFGLYKSPDGYFGCPRSIIEMDFEAKAESMLLDMKGRATGLAHERVIHVRLMLDGRVTSKRTGQVEIATSVLTPDNPDKIHSPHEIRSIGAWKGGDEKEAVQRNLGSCDPAHLYPPTTFFLALHYALRDII